MPWRLFLLFYRDLEREEARCLLSRAQAAVLGTRAGMGGKEANAQLRQIRKLIND